MYSPYVFAIGQLLGEIPYNVLCGLLYWVLMVRFVYVYWPIYWHFLQVFPIGFGQGTYGLNGAGFQLLIVLFMLLFGISLGQLIAALSPSVQVSVYVIWRLLILQWVSPGCRPLQPLYRMVFEHFLWHNNPFPHIKPFLEDLDVSVWSLYPNGRGRGINRTSVRFLCLLYIILLT